MVTAILSVNCAYVCALQRLLNGASEKSNGKDLGNYLIFSISKHLFFNFKTCHKAMLKYEKEEESEKLSDINSEASKPDTSNSKLHLRSILNCFLHFFLFGGITGKLVLDLIRFMVISMSEADTEVLLFVCRNVGL